MTERSGPAVGRIAADEDAVPGPMVSNALAAHCRASKQVVTACAPPPWVKAAPQSCLCICHDICCGLLRVRTSRESCTSEYGQDRCGSARPDYHRQDRHRPLSAARWCGTRRCRDVWEVPGR